MIDEMAKLLKEARAWVGLTAIIAPDAIEARVFHVRSHELRNRIDKALAAYAIEKAVEESSEE